MSNHRAQSERGEWGRTRSAVGNDNIQQLSTKGPEHTHTHANTHIQMACKNAQNHREEDNKQAARMGLRGKNECLDIKRFIFI